MTVPGWSRWIGLLLVMGCGGCAPWSAPQIDPTGQSLVVTQPDFTPEPGPMRPWDQATLTVQPQTIVAPAGSEVVLVASVFGPDGRLGIDQPVQWTLEPSGVGHFVDLEQRGLWKFFLGPRVWPRKIDATHAIGITSDRYTVLTRGTPTRDDDVPISRGQTWITVTSPTEGTSYVTVFSPVVYGWDRRKVTATIQWLDAQWAFPPPATVTADTRHVLTTTVVRRTDRSPLPGWIVRYQTTGGVPAGFAPDGAQTVEVQTDLNGQANAEIFQTSPAGGATQVSVQLLRPPTASDNRALPVADSSVQVTWTAAEVTLLHTGPVQGTPGAVLSYQIEVANRGEAPSQAMTVGQQLPAGLVYLNSDPPAEVAGDRLTWRLSELPPGGVHRLTVNARADATGTFQPCATLTTADGLVAEQCVTTVVAPAAAAPGTLDVQMIGPAQQVSVGSDATFEIVVTNRSSATLRGLRLVDTYDAGLVHRVAQGPIERMLEDLLPGASRRIGVTFNVTAPGRLCNQVEVTAEGGVQAQARACITAVQAGAPTPAPPPPAREPPRLSVRKTGPQERQVGQTAEFVIEVTNDGPTAATDLTVADDYDPALEATLATEGFRLEGDRLVWDIARLEPGATQRFQINCNCLRTAAQACNRVTVTVPGAAPLESEACVRITAPPGTAETRVTLSASDLRDPVEVGRQFTYEIRVGNPGQTPARGVRLTVRIPDNLLPVPLGTTGPTPVSIQGQNVQFDTLAEIAPGRTVIYRVRVHARAAGEARLQAEATLQGQAPPMRIEETTTVVAPR